MKKTQILMIGAICLTTFGTATAQEVSPEVPKETPEQIAAQITRRSKN